MAEENVDARAAALVEKLHRAQTGFAIGGVSPVGAGVSCAATGIVESAAATAARLATNFTDHSPARD